MRRRSRVVSQGLVVSPSEFPTTNEETQEEAKNGVIDNTVESAHIPSLAPSFSLFTRFQERNSDFSSDWMLVDETDTSRLISPINQELTHKLRQHKDSIQTQRFNAANGFSANISAQSTAATSKTLKTISEKSDSEDEREYVPGETNVMMRKEPKHEPCSDDNVNSFSEGIQGDYLSFLPTVNAKDDVAKTDLQATLTMQEGEDGMTLLNASLQERQGFALEPSAAAQHRVVPLWSVDRFTRQGGYSSNPLIALHQEICDFVEYMCPSKAELHMRNFIAMEVSLIAKRLWPDCEPIVFGSMLTGLLLPLSDLDMSILNVPMSTEDALIALAREIGRESLCHAAYPQLILKTKVPLVKFQHRISMLNVDISVNAADGRRNSAIVSDMLRSFPEARPLTLLVKYFLQQRDMHEPYYGGLGSFATTLLVISFLQNHPIYTTRPEERKCSGLGRLLVDFFRYYGMCFNYERCGVSLLNGGRYFCRTDTLMLTQTNGTCYNNTPMRQAQVVIEDPGCKENNAASSLRSFHVITSLFTYAYRALTAEFDASRGGRAHALSPDSTEVVRRPTLLSRILHVDAASVSRRRLIAAAYDTLMQDDVQRERLLAAAAQSEDMAKAAGKTPSRDVSKRTDGARNCGRGRVFIDPTTTTSEVSIGSSSRRSNSSSSYSRADSNNNMRGTSSNDSSVRVIFRPSHG